MTDDDKQPAKRSNSLSYPASRLSAPIELVDLAMEIAQADAMLNSRVSAKLKVIADQIKHLQQQAQQVLEETRRDQQLNHAQCAFKRIPGKTYHLYLKHDQQLYFSMLAPEDWGGHPPHAYQGSYRLENDLSWTALDGSEQDDDSREIVERLLKHITD